MRASTFVTYGQSEDPASPYFDDYSRRYSKKRWVRASFTRAEVHADTRESFEVCSQR